MSGSCDTAALTSEYKGSRTMYITKLANLLNSHLVLPQKKNFARMMLVYFNH